MRVKLSDWISVGLTVWFGLIAVGEVSAEPEGFQTLQIGQSAPDFELPGVDGKTYRLADFADHRLLLVVFTCNHCPTAQAYEDRLIQIHRDYHDRGVAMVAISPNDAQAVHLGELGYSDLGDSLEEMKLRAQEKGFPFPYLYDGETQKTALAYGVLATPHVYLFDSQRKLQYVGRVDDGEVTPPKSHDLRNAMDALLADQPVKVPRTRVFGCSTKWSDKRGSVAEQRAKWDAEPVTLEVVDAEAIKELATNSSQKYRLINVWATWCAPCVDELPQLVDVHRMYRGRPFEMITISIDEPTAKDQALEVLQKVRASSKNLLYGSDDYDRLAEVLDPQWPGPVPYTVLIAPGGQVVYRQNGPIDLAKLKRAIVSQLGRTYAAKE
ncbi:MAG: redoxin domain-containing protein [Pirellulales bacterium]